jgi:hypothetical protein
MQSKTTVLSNYCFSLIAIAILGLSSLGCGGGNADQAQIPTDTVAPPKVQVKPIGPPSRFEGVIVGQGVRARSGPNSTAEVVRPLNTGTKVRSIGTSEQRDKLTSGSICDDLGYYWYNLEVSEGQPVWVFGKFVYAIDDLAPKVYQTPLTFDGATYRLVRALENSYGPNDQSGLTGCDVRMVHFLKDDRGTLIPIRLGKAAQLDRLKKASEAVGNGLLILTAQGDGQYHELASTAETQYQGKDAVELKYTIGAQTGKGTLTLTIVASNGEFEVADAKETWE